MLWSWVPHDYLTMATIRKAAQSLCWQPVAPPHVCISILVAVVFIRLFQRRRRNPIQVLTLHTGQRCYLITCQDLLVSVASPTPWILAHTARASLATPETIGARSDGFAARLSLNYSQGSQGRSARSPRRRAEFTSPMPPANATYLIATWCVGDTRHAMLHSKIPPTRHNTETRLRGQRPAHGTCTTHRAEKRKKLTATLKRVGAMGRTSCSNLV